MCDPSEQQDTGRPQEGRSRGTLASAGGPAAFVRAGRGPLAVYSPFVLEDMQGAGTQGAGPQGAGSAGEGVA